VFDAQRELRGIAFLTGAEYQDDAASSGGPKRPENETGWKDLVQSMVKGTMTTAHALRVLQKVLDSSPDESYDSTDALQAMRFPLHQKFMTELGLSAAAASSSLRNLLSIAVAAGAPPEVAPWSRYAQMQSDIGQGVAGGKRREQDEVTESEDSSEASYRPSGPGASGAKNRMSLDQRLAQAASSKKLVATGRSDVKRTLPEPEDTSGDDPPSSHRATRRMAINRRLELARQKQKAALGAIEPAKLPPLQKGLQSPARLQAEADAASAVGGSGFFGSLFPGGSPAGGSQGTDPFPARSYNFKSPQPCPQSGGDKGTSPSQKLVPVGADREGTRRRDMREAFSTEKQVPTVERPPSDRERRRQERAGRVSWEDPDSDREGAPSNRLSPPSRSASGAISSALGRSPVSPGVRRVAAVGDAEPDGNGPAKNQAGTRYLL